MRSAVLSLDNPELLPLLKINLSTPYGETEFDILELFELLSTHIYSDGIIEYLIDTAVSWCPNVDLMDDTIEIWYDSHKSDFLNIVTVMIERVINPLYPDGEIPADDFDRYYGELNDGLWELQETFMSIYSGWGLIVRSLEESHGSLDCFRRIEFTHNLIILS